jgi:hypothetical protein
MRERIPADWAAAREERAKTAVEWRWAETPTGDEDLSPLQHERNGHRAGVPRELPPPDDRSVTIYGYDAGGRAVIAIDHYAPDGDEAHTLLWHGHSESLVLQATAPRERSSGGFRPPELDAASRSRNEAGRPVLIEHFGANGRSVERCRWEGEHLVEAVAEGRSVGRRDVLAWQGSTLVRVERHWDHGEVEVTFERLPAGVTLDALLREIEDELVEKIALVAPAFGAHGPVCALALGYCHGESSLPPNLVACPDAVRKRLLEENDDDFWYRWQAAEWMSAAEVPQLVHYGGPDFNARCEQVDRQVRLGGDERVTGRLLQAVALRLNEMDWRSRLDVTGDFLVYPWEIHGESLEEDLAASAPPGAPGV